MFKKYFLEFWLQSYKKLSAEQKNLFLFYAEME